MVYLALTGGIGGAKLGLGLARILQPDALSFLVNTGDDFEHLGLHVSPDVDTLTYTLAGASNTALGWGRKDETWRFMAALEALGGETWFRLGDADLALHVTRTQMLKQGATLTEAIRTLSARLGVAHSIIPMSDDPVRTLVHTADGPLFVPALLRAGPLPTAGDRLRVRRRRRRRRRPKPGPAGAAAHLRRRHHLPLQPLRLHRPHPVGAGLGCGPESLRSAHRRRLPHRRRRRHQRPYGKKMMAELGVPATAEQVAEHYRGLIDGFILDVADADLHGALGVPTRVQRSVMVTLEDRERLAAGALEFIKELSANLRPTAPLTIDDAGDRRNCDQ